MKRILLTGSTGFIGRNIEPLLSERYDVYAPSRAQLDLSDGDKVRRYLADHNFDAVVHLANPTAQNPIDAKEELLERSLKVFASLERCADLYAKMIYLGSGAEYGKHRALTQVDENEFGKELPRDAYGLSRYIMSKLADSHDNIINLRLFGCYGPGDPSFKLVPYILSCIGGQREIRLRQDVWFDFLYVEDILPVLVYFIENNSACRAYNLCHGERICISSIAEEILSQTGARLPIVYDKGGLGPEYTGSVARLSAEMPLWKPISIIEGIRRILKYENWKA